MTSRQSRHHHRHRRHRRRRRHRRGRSDHARQFRHHPGDRRAWSRREPPEAVTIGGGTIINEAAASSPASSAPSPSTTAEWRQRLCRDDDREWRPDSRRQWRGDLHHRHLCRHHHQSRHDRRQRRTRWRRRYRQRLHRRIFTSTIDGGDGTDTFNLLGTGSGTLAHTVNFEVLDVQGGNWIVTDAESFTSGITVETGAQLAIADGGSLTGDVTDNGVFGVDAFRRLRLQRLDFRQRQLRPGRQRHHRAEPRTAIPAARPCMPARSSWRRWMRPAPGRSPSRAARRR